MDALCLNGIPIPISVSGASIQRQRSGKNQRVYSGGSRSSVRAVKRVWQFSTPPLTPEDGQRFRYLIAGTGYAPRFALNLYPFSGDSILGVNSGWTVEAYAPFTGAAKHSGAAGDSITYTGVLGSTYCVVFWATDAGTWKHYVITSDGTARINGVVSSVPGVFTKTGSNLVLQSVAGRYARIANLWIIPYAVGSTWPGSIYAAAYQGGTMKSLAPAPWVSASGFLVDASGLAPIVVRGEVGDVVAVGFQGSAGWTVGEQFTFSLYEV